jgi:hypothetical protein
LGGDDQVLVDEPAELLEIGSIVLDPVDQLSIVGVVDVRDPERHRS